METPKLDFFLGKIREVKDRVTYEVTVDIPGIGEELKAYPYSRGEMDEPVEGNLVYLLSVDPMYHSVFLYLKAKENDFIGIRSNGKLIDITPEAITIGVYPESKTVADDERPDPETSYVRMDNSGNIEIMATSDMKVKISGSVTIEVSGDCDLKVSGKTVLNSPEVQITGGKLTTPNGGTVSPTSTGGFCALPFCCFSGAPQTGPSIEGT